MNNIETVKNKINSLNSKQKLLFGIKMANKLLSYIKFYDNELDKNLYPKFKQITTQLESIFKNKINAYNKFKLFFEENRDMFISILPDVDEFEEENLDIADNALYAGSAILNISNAVVNNYEDNGFIVASTNSYEIIRKKVERSISKLKEIEMNDLMKQVDNSLEVIKEIEAQLEMIKEI